MTKVSPQVLIAVALVSNGILLLELGLTRIFSVVGYYHYSFLCVSIAMFGLSASAVLVHLRPQLWAPETAQLWAQRFAGGFAWLTLLAMASLTGFVPLRGASGLNLGVASLLGAVPLLAAGAFISIVIAWRREEIHKVYAADLVGAGLGCLLVIPTLDKLGGLGPLLVASLLAAIGAALLGSRLSWVLSALLSVVCVAQLVSPALTLAQTNKVDNRNPILSRWNSHSLVSVYRDPHPDWGLSPEYEGAHPETYFLNIDASASSPILLASSLEQVAYLRQELTAFGYHLLAKDGDALVIGSGGGRDIWTALLFGAGHVIGVEINPIIVYDVMGDLMAKDSGNIYANPKVEIHCDDGRSFVAREKRQFDLIQASMVDTWAATSAGAFALSENNLYTVEAFQEYIKHLKPDGTLTVTRWELDGPRLILVARAAAEGLGMGSIEDRLFVVAGPDSMQLGRALNWVFKKSALTSEEIERLKKRAQELGFEVLYSPDLPDCRYAYLLKEQPEVLVNKSVLDISAVDDNRPFFFLHVKPEQVPKLIPHLWNSRNGIVLLMRLTFISAVAVVLFILVPLGLRRAPEARLPFVAQALFAALGAGYMVTEISLIQRFSLFLGAPVLSLAVVLFTLLLGSGLGSWLARGRDPKKSLCWAGLVSAVLVTVYAFGLPVWTEALQSWSRFGRISMTIIILLPLAVAMGMPLPAGMVLATRNRPDSAALAWAINGATSIMGSSLAVLLSIFLGFRAVGVIAGVTYLSVIGLGLLVAGGANSD